MFNHLIISIVATMLGVIFGIYISNILETKKIREQSEVGTSKIMTELRSNKDIVARSAEVHIRFANLLEFVQKNIDENDELITDQKTMSDFQKRYPEAIVLQDSTELKPGIFKYVGDIQLDIDNIASFSISNVAWTSFMQANLIATIEYDCAYYLSSLQVMQEEVIRENSALLTMVKSNAISDEEMEKIIRQSRYLADLESSLLQAYEPMDSKLADCL